MLFRQDYALLGGFVVLGATIGQEKVIKSEICAACSINVFGRDEDFRD